MKKNIAVSKEARENIAKAFGVTMRTVWNALNLEYPANRHNQENQEGGKRVGRRVHGINSGR